MGFHVKFLEMNTFIFLVSLGKNSENLILRELLVFSHNPHGSYRKAVGVQ